ncbi:MAG: glycerophosphodiester phosphodiesterase family protein [Flavobacteriales bacterium]|nr:glycerophosphodiester phosphodiesterase family protein [Flavobacteriales bacterium]
MFSRFKITRFVLLFVAVSLIDKVFCQGGFDIQGHRGYRARYPENSIPGFIAALDSGATTLELDVVISADHQVVVSHEPWISSKICTTPDGMTLEERDEQRLNIYRMNYEDIRGFDCGSIGNERFPLQRKMKVYKPLLAEVIDAALAWEKKHSKLVYFNIETKSTPSGDYKNHPSPDTFCVLLYQVLKEKNIISRTSIQSFDYRTLRTMHSMDENIPLIILSASPVNILKIEKKYGFKAYAYSPYYPLVSKSMVQRIHAIGKKIIPWTVNDAAIMKKLHLWGVDGIISDDPGLLRRVCEP